MGLANLRSPDTLENASTNQVDYIQPGQGHPSLLPENDGLLNLLSSLSCYPLNPWCHSSGCGSGLFL